MGNAAQKRPPVPIPEPLRASEIGTFTHHSVVERLPDIGRKTLSGNNFLPATNAALEALINGIPHSPIRPLTDTQAPDSADWAAYVAPYEGLNWLDVPWFFAETYFYRRILEATSYFIPDHAQYGRDPFAGEKREGLDANRKKIRELIEWIDALFSVERIKPELGLYRLLAVALWGNQADLSLWPASRGEQPQHNSQDEERAHVLADDSELAVRRLNAQRRGQVDVIMDNAGFELISDLCLTDFLLFSGLAEEVRWHLKIHPTFVSDATISDVHQTIAWLMNSSVPILFDIGRRLQAYLDWDRWELVDHPFWTSPLPMWEMTADLTHQLSHSNFIITKGDANYRRLLGDRHWPFTTPFQEIVTYMPAPLLALRTIKSEVAAGLTAEKMKEAKTKDPDWLTSGRWGLMQMGISDW